MLFILFILLAGYSNKGHAQAKITGPVCIMAGTEYQYNLHGVLDINTALNICVEGGYLSMDNSTCNSFTGINNIHITWNDGIANGKISITNSAFDTSILEVTKTQSLNGGQIDSLSKLQAVRPFDIPQKIYCSAAFGGSCSPVNVYQWEQSDDALHWTEVTGATSKDFFFSGSLDHTIFFRRRIFESISNSTSYSDLAIVSITITSGTN